MSQYLLYEYLPGFALTIAAELGVAVVFGLWTFRPLSRVVLVNLITHPALHLFLWLAFWGRQGLPPWGVLVALELAVVLAEGVLLWRWLPWPAGKALGLSAVMNATSCLVGWAVAA